MSTSSMFTKNTISMIIKPFPHLQIVCCFRNICMTNHKSKISLLCVRNIFPMKMKRQKDNIRTNIHSIEQITVLKFCDYDI